MKEGLDNQLGLNGLDAAKWLLDSGFDFCWARFQIGAQ